MSNQVDNRVVSMQFDNKRFEKNVATSLNTLDKLKRGLKLDGATKGLENVDSAAKKIDMSSLGKAVETVNSRFSALGIMGVTALANITNSAVNAGKQMVKALTIDPIKAGFSEYETQINSVQTILANTESKGSTLQDVNNALAELNTYADKTIYNFTEMTRNIGTFTAAGVDLKTSTAAIKGIANLAAVSGSTSQQASTAMYQLSQAMSSGTVKLMDWNSVVNAGMGGQVFQDALKETARVHKINIDEMIKTEGSFRETLKNGWLTTDILTETLSKFTGDLSAEQLKQMGYSKKQIESIIKMGQTANDAATKVKTFTQLFDTLKEAAQSGWTKTWEIIVGDFGEAKELLTEISDMFGGVIGESADSRNELLSGTLSTGWKQLLNEGITDAEGFEERVKEVAKKHGVDLSKMINAETSFQDSLKQGWMTTDILSESITEYGKKLNGMSKKQLEAAGYTMKDVEAFAELEKKLKSGEISLEEFTSLLSRKSGRELLIESLRNALKGLMSIITPIKEAFREIFPPTTSAQLYSLIEKFNAFTAKLVLNEKQSENLKRIFKGLFAVVDIGVTAVKAIASGIAGLIRYIAPAGEGLFGLTASFGDWLVKVRDAIKAGNIFGKIIAGIGAFLKPIADGIVEMGRTIYETFTEISSKVQMRFSPLTFLGNALKAIFLGIGAILAKILPAAANIAKGVGSIFTSIMDKISTSIQNADYNGLFDFINGGIFSAIGIFIARFIKSGGDVLKNASGILDSIKEVIGGVSEALGAFTQQLKAKALKEIATAIAILAAALLVISMIDSEKLASSLGAVTLMLVELMSAMNILGNMDGDTKSFAKVAIIARTMKSLAVALLILSVAMKIASTMSMEEMGIGLTAITVGLAALVGAVNLLPSDKKVNSAARAIKKLSTAMVILAIALKIMGSMSWQELGVGLTAMASGLTMMVAAVNLLPKDTSKRTAGMTKLAIAMVILGAALKIMGSMSWQEIGRGLTTMAAGLVLMVGAVNLLPKDTALRTLGMLGLATALVVMAAALKIMGSMSWQEMGIALITLAGSMTVITIAMNLMRKALPGAVAMVFIAGALAILAPVLKIFGSMSLVEIAKGLGVLAGVFAVLGLAGLILAPVVPAILGLAAAIALLGVGVLATGVGVIALAAGITALGAAFGVAGAGIVTFISATISLIPFFFKQIGVGIIELCNTIAGSVDAICAAVTTIVVAVVESLVTSIPTIAQGTLQLIVTILEILIEYLPQIVPLLVELFAKLVDLIVENMPSILDSMIKFLVALIEGMATRLGNLLRPLLNLFATIFEGIAGIIGPIVQEVIIPILGVLLDYFVKFFEIIAPYIPDICNLFSSLATTISNAIVSIVTVVSPYIPVICDLLETIATAVSDIVSEISPILDSLSGIFETLGTAIKDSLDGCAGILESFGEAANDALSGLADVIDSIGDVISAFFEGIADVIEAVGKAGKNLGEGFKDIAEGAKIIAGLSFSTITNSFIALGNAIELMRDKANAEEIYDIGAGMKNIADAVKKLPSSFGDVVKTLSAIAKVVKDVGPEAVESMNELESSMRDAASKIKEHATTIKDGVAAIITDLQTLGTEAGDEVTDLMLGLGSIIWNYKNTFYELGKHLIGGLASGIRDYKAAAVSEAQAVANAVEAVIRVAWKINSPSKVFYKIALGIGEGITNALGDSTVGVKRSARDLADTTTKGFGSAISKINEMIDGTFDAQPTIRPVLDLSDVQSGANSIAGMFDGNRTLAISAPGIGAISAAMTSRQNKNNDLVSAINKLAKSNNKSGDTYNFNGFSYSEGSDVADAINTLVRAAKMEGRT